MRKNLHLLLSVTIIVFLSSQTASAQNGTPYWSTLGNSNATSTSKLGTTNAINLRLFTNNAERMRISTSGMVGIGAVSPTERLHVNSLTGTNALRVQVNGNTKLLVHSGGGVAIGGNIAPPTNGLYVNGKVGIGTTTQLASYKMNVSGGGIKVYQYWTTGESNVSYGVYAEGATGVRGIGMTGVSGDGMTGVEGTGYWGVYGNGSVGVVGYSEEGTAGSFESNSGTGLEARTTSGPYAGAFYGAVYLSSGYTASDKNLKQNVQEFEGALEIISKLKPRQYEFKTEAKYAFLHLPKGHQYGLLAQDVEEVLPDLVSTADHKMIKGEVPQSLVKPDAFGKMPARQQLTKARPETMSIKAVNYIELIPIMIKGMQELRYENEELKKNAAETEALKAELAELRQMVHELKGVRSNTNIFTSTYMRQNTPNPVKTSTRISYNLPEGATKGQLLLTDALGRTLKAVQLSSSGTLNLDASALSSGTYNYSLVVDGKTLQTRKMTVVK
jgi:hypothetical protein